MMQTNTSATQNDWHPADIIAALHKRGTTISKLAHSHGVDPSGLSLALRRSFPKGEQRIADALGMHPKDIWPSRYFDDGTRKPVGARAIQCTAAVRHDGESAELH
ncbi:helix-turn-helix domain-containing protein [Andreprevotia chitinilytica]|uniref:helix-turn-helix domain-containing protein n=1 Tax=Andreprevotia chitinilytica TaxID=396808 RepID=UPI000ABDA7A0|nr:helix-turn-helix transcriptional regulator [Andreprevotia chitinilytica]